VAVDPNPVTPPTPPDGNAEVQPKWHNVFAIITFVVAALLALLLMVPLLLEFLDLDQDDWFGKNGDTAFAASLALPLSILGAVLLAVGTWMAVVEWRGRFKPEPTVVWGGAEVKPGEIIDALGKLRGPALVLLTGAVLMLGAAWVAQSTAEEPPAPTTTTPTTTTP
jgi:hypothetical protein